MGCQDHHAMPHSCPQCEFEPFVRNHFFTGKMMGVGEFTTQWRYHAEKMRHHNLRLHGWGVVCGLEVSQHPSPDCSTRYVLVDEGSALDCCGREILVAQQEIVDIARHPAVVPLASDGLLHTLQLAVCHRECPTETVPVLYDECGCDDTQCAPNRILESFAFDVLVDPPLTGDYGVGDAAGAIVASDLHGVIGAMRASADGKIAVVDPGNALRLLLLDPARRSLQSVVLPAAARALALDVDGTHCFVVIDPIAGIECEVHVYRVADGTEVMPAATRTVQGTTSASVLLAAATADPARRLLVLSGGQLHAWKADTTTPAQAIEDAEAGAPVAFAAGATTFVALADGSRAAAADGTKVHVVDLATSSTSMLAGLPASAKPGALAWFDHAGTPVLAIASADEKRVYLVEGTGAAAVLSATVALAHAPQAIASGPDGAWIAVFEQEAGRAWLQTVVLPTIAGAIASAPRVVGDGNRQLVVLSTDGQGAVLDATAFADGDCAELLWCQLACDGCAVPECIVLATIANYRPGMAMLDAPAADDDLAQKIARIDNRRGRRMLASTATLQAWLQCLQLKGGVPGPAGPAGKPGKDGVGLPGDSGPIGPAGPAGVLDTRVEVGDCKTKPALALQGSTLLLTLPKCCGEDCVQLCSINWRHAAPNAGLDSLILAFNGELEPADVDVTKENLYHAFIVETHHEQRVDDGRMVLECWCQVPGKYETLKLEQRCDLRHGGGSAAAPDAIRFLPAIEGLFKDRNRRFRVRFRGDLVRGLNGRAVDANHLPKWLETTPGGPSSGDCIEGGTFYSWFRIGR